MKNPNSRLLGPLLSPSITNKVDLQPYLSFDCVCHLAIKVEKQLKGRKLFQTASSIRPSSTAKGYSTPTKLSVTYTRQDSWQG